MYASFDSFEIQMTKAQALSASHPGPCDKDVQELLKLSSIKRQLKKISDKDLIDELRQYGCWEEFGNRQENESRIVWIAACNISDDIKEKTK